MERQKHSRYILPRPQFGNGRNSSHPIWFKGICAPFYWCQSKPYELLKDMIDLQVNNKNKHVFERRWEGQHTEWIIFHGACYYGRLDIVEYMLSIPFIGINNNKNNIHQTLLLSAIWGNQIAVVRRLVEHPSINVNKRGNYGMFPLEIAVSKGYLEIVKLLLAHPKILINQRTKQEFLTDLGRCLEYEADPNTYTCIDLASMRENIDILQLLLEKGAEQSNVLYHASRIGMEENVRYLLNQPQITKKQGCLYAAVSGGHFWTVIELLKDDFYKDNKTEHGDLEYMAALEEVLDMRIYECLHEYILPSPSTDFFNRKICAYELMNYHTKQQARYLTEINLFAGLPWLPYDILRNIYKMTRYVHPKFEDPKFRSLWRKATKNVLNKRVECFEPDIDDKGLPEFPRYAFIE